MCVLKAGDGNGDCAERAKEVTLDGDEGGQMDGGGEEEKVALSCLCAFRCCWGSRGCDCLRYRLLHTHRNMFKNDWKLHIEVI